MNREYTRDRVRPMDRVYTVYTGLKFESDAHLPDDRDRELKDTISMLSESYTLAHPLIRIRIGATNLAVPRTVLVLTVLISICNRNGLDYTRYSLLSAGRPLVNTHSLEQCHIIDGDVLDLAASRDWT